MLSHWGKAKTNISIFLWFWNYYLEDYPKATLRYRIYERVIELSLYPIVAINSYTLIIHNLRRAS